jgi:uncharacterized protein YecE (DUF72 family)
VGMQPLLSNLVDPPLGFSDKTIRRVGTAGWAVPRAVAGDFPAVGSTLERYCARFDAVEINSTFYRSHRPSTYLRWAMATPPHFRFALKLPRTITHHARLVNVTSLLTGFVAEALHLGEKLGPLLVQLPPSLAYDAAVAEPFFRELWDLWPAAMVCEPRHGSWFEAEADALMAACDVGRVAADPPPHPAAAAPGGWRGISYWRLHGSPRMYYSTYGQSALLALAADVLGSTGETWCVFDNTASGAATANALRLLEMIAT